MFFTIACLLYDSIAAFLGNMQCTKMIINGSDGLASIISNFQSIKTFQCTEMYPECVIASWDALILLLDAENIE